jgi:hypothetical protein
LIIEIDGVEYPFPTKFSYGDLTTIKRIAKVHGGELEAALEAGDSDVIIALAAIALERAGLTPDLDKLYALEVGAIVAKEETGQEEDTTLPPVAAGEDLPGNGKSTLSAIPPATHAASGVQR